MIVRLVRVSCDDIKFKMDRLMRINVVISCCAALLLSACGGSGGGGASPDEVTLEELQSRSETFFAAIGTENFEDADPTPFANLPTSGSRSYTGIAIVGVEAEGENDDNAFLAIGSSTLVADFDDHEISGSANNFFQISNPNVDSFANLEGERIDGRLTYELDQIAAGTNAYSGQITGSVTPSDGPRIDVNLSASGAFIGDNAEQFAAEAFNDDSEVFSGVFANQD